MPAMTATSPTLSSTAGNVPSAPRIVRATDLPSRSAKAVDANSRFVAIVPAATSARTAMNSKLSLGGSIASKTKAASITGVADPAMLISSACQR